jgi:valyl-tRNA synthetase
MLIYKLYWDEFSGWYLEIVKPEFGKSIDVDTFYKTIGFFEELLKLLHPFMPFITEELYQTLQQREKQESIMYAQIKNKKQTAKNQEVIPRFEKTKEIIAGIRTIRQQKSISPKEALTLFVKGNYDNGFDAIIKKSANISKIEIAEEKTAHSISYLVGTTEYFIPVEINKEEEIKKMETEINYLQGFLKSVQNKLSNEKFVANAKPEVVENERKKFADAESKIKSLEENIDQLKK